MNIFKQELKMTRKSLIIWSICLFIFIYLCMYKYNAAAATGTSMNDLIAAMPKSLQTLLGVGTFDLSTAIGYYAALYPYIAIVLGIHSAMIGSRIISKEEEDKTSEFLMTKPISRGKVITAKILVAVANVVIVNIVAMISSILLFNSVSDSSITKEIVILMLGLLAVQLIFLTIGFVIAASLNKPRKAIAISNGLLLFSFITYLIVEMSGKLNYLIFISPFEYFTPKMLLVDKEVNIFCTLLTVIIIAGSIIMTYRNYSRRDLKN